MGGHRIGDILENIPPGDSNAHLIQRRPMPRGCTFPQSVDLSTGKLIDECIIDNTPDSILNRTIDHADDLRV